MSSWGMNDGAALSGAAKFTNGANTFIDGASGSNTTFVTDKLQAGDVVVGADGLLYRVTAVTSETAATLDRNYSGTTADNQTVTRVKLPRHIKVTKDDGTGHSLATLGIFGFSGAEAMAGGDDVVAIANKKNTYSGAGQDTDEGGAGYTSAPTVTVTQPTAHAFDATSTSVVVAATNAIVLGSTNLPATGTNLRYYNFPGGSYSAKSGTTSGAVPGGDLSNNDIVFARQANTTAIYLYDTFARATANNGIGIPATGLQSITGVSGTAGNHTLVGQTAAATAVLSGGKVASYTITTSGSDYLAGAPTITVAQEEHTFNAASAVAANGEITISSHTFIVGDRVQYDINSGTAITELTDAAFYYVTEIASNKLYLSATKGGAKITLTDGSSENHKLKGEAATATAVLGAGRAGAGDQAGRKRDMKGAHLGWVKRTIGTGGRAGRVHYETLVAASSITGDGEDLATPDE